MTEIDKKPWLTVTAAAWVALALAAATAIYLGREAIGFWLGGASAPAWVQAIGSIAAIIAAVWVVEAQHRQSVRLALDMDARRAKRRHNAIVGLMLFAQLQVREGGAAAKARLCGELVDMSPSIEMLTYAETELSSINLSELDSFYMVAGVRRMLGCVRQMRYLCQESERIASFVAPTLAAAHSRQADVCIQSTVDAFRDVAEKALTELNEDPRSSLPW